MRQQLSEQELLVTDSVTFPLELPEPSLFPAKTFGVDENNALHSFCHADGSYHLMGCMLSAASCNKWWAEEIFRQKISQQSRHRSETWRKQCILPSISDGRKISA